MIIEFPVIVILYGVLLCLFTSNQAVYFSLLRLRRQTSTTSVILIP